MSLSRNILLTEEDIEKYCKEQKLNIEHHKINNTVNKTLNTLIEHWKREFRPIYQKMDEVKLIFWRKYEK